jgi:hypothetical protein
MFEENLYEREEKVVADLRWWLNTWADWLTDR